jgi:hypothetical protein
VRLTLLTVRLLAGMSAGLLNWEQVVTEIIFI